MNCDQALLFFCGRRLACLEGDFSSIPPPNVHCPFVELKKKRSALIADYLCRWESTESESFGPLCICVIHLVQTLIDKCFKTCSYNYLWTKIKQIISLNIFKYHTTRNSEIEKLRSSIKTLSELKIPRTSFFIPRRLAFTASGMKTRHVNSRIPPVAMLKSRRGVWVVLLKEFLMIIVLKSNKYFLHRNFNALSSIPYSTSVEIPNIFTFLLGY